MRTKNLFIGFLAASFFMAGCEKDNDNQTTVLVSTSAISNIAGGSATDPVSATSGGDVDVVGAESITERGVVWGTNTKPTTADNKAAAGTGGIGNFSANLTGLTFGQIYYVRAYVINNGQPYYGNELKFTASVPVELIKNGNFEVAGDPSYLVNSLDWKTDEADAGIIGRGTDSRNPTNYIWTYSTSKSFYQVVGTVPTSASDYVASFDGNYDWTDWGDGYATTIGVIFSAYSGTDPSTRVAIDTVIIGSGGFPGYGNNWGRKSGSSLTIPAGSAYAGQNLVIELDLLPYIDPATGDPWDDTVWYNFDNVSVIQTLR